MAYKQNRMLYSRAPKEVTLHVKVKCLTCQAIDNSECVEHDGGIEDVELKVVGIPWAKLNYIKSQCVSFDENQQTHFDSQQYVSECLKNMIVEAPWPKTDDVFLLTVDACLGAELEKIIPTAYESDSKDMEKNFVETKKG